MVSKVSISCFANRREQRNSIYVNTRVVVIFGRANFASGGMV